MIAIDQWGVWSGGEGRRGIAVLVVVVTGYHNKTRYQWSDESGDLCDEIFPVIYVTRRSTYTCTCVIADFGVSAKLTFKVKEGAHV